MVVSSLHRKLLRDILGAKGQYSAVAAVLFCGVAIQVSMYSAMRNLSLTRDAYQREYRLADLFFHFERAPRSTAGRLASLPGAERARGRIVKDITLDMPDNPDPVTGRIVSIPWPREPMLNDIHIVEGGYPSGRSSNEVLLNPKFASANGLEVGSVIRAVVNTRQFALKVAGTALSPEYVVVVRDAAAFIPDDRGFGILYAPDGLAETLFGMEEAVNDAVVSAAAGSDLDDLKRRAEDLLGPFGLTVKADRKEQLSCQFLDSEINGLRDTAAVVPPIFLAGVLSTLRVLGIPPGLLLGRWLARVTVDTYATDLFRIPYVVSFESDLQAAGLVAIFAALAGLAGARKLGKLDMVEALKARE